MIQKHSLNFGKKEKALTYACQATHNPVRDLSSVEERGHNPSRMPSGMQINKEKLVAGKFSWQEGYGAFSYSKSQISTVAKYIENQEGHHNKKTFIEEYKKILNDFGIEYDERYIFKTIE